MNQFSTTLLTGGLALLLWGSGGEQLHQDTDPTQLVSGDAEVVGLYSESMNDEIADNLRRKADEWGLNVTSTAITDVIVDDQTKDAQRQQLNADREMRAAIARAEGDKRSVELAAEAQLFEAEKQAEAIRVTADAEAYAIKAKAEADAEQTRVVAAAIEDNGQPAIDFEIAKRQVGALAEVAAGESSKVMFLPTNVTEILGSVTTVFETINSRRLNDN